MKTYTKIIIFSCFLGALLSGIFLFSFKEKASAKEKNTIYLFQVGVYKSKDSATLESNNYKVSKIIKDNDLYRIIIGATVNNLSKYEEQFHKDNINYYVKELNLGDDIKTKVKKYDELMQDCDLFSVSKNVLGELPNEL